MQLLKEILIDILAKNEISITFPNLTLTAAQIVEQQSFNALQKIKYIIENDELTDFDCVERIVSVFEEMGCPCKSRHDF